MMKNANEGVSARGRAGAEASVVDYGEWGRRWDAQQAYLVVRREERFGVMLDLAAEVLGRPPERVLDLACGTGDVARRVMDRFPEAKVIGLDADPLLLDIAQGAIGGAGGRASWVRADLRNSDWANLLEPFGNFELVVSSTALHWLPMLTLSAVYCRLPELMAPGGLFANADVIPSVEAGRLATAGSTLRSRAARQLQETTTGERYTEWWEAVRREPGLAETWRQRASVFQDHPAELELPSAEFHVQALRQAGFEEAAVMWRFFDYAVVGAVKEGPVRGHAGSVEALS